MSPNPALCGSAPKPLTYRMYCQLCGELVADCRLRSHPAAARRHRARRHPAYIGSIRYRQTPPDTNWGAEQHKSGGDNVPW